MEETQSCKHSFETDKSGGTNGGGALMEHSLDKDNTCTICGQCDINSPLYVSDIFNSTYSSPRQQIDRRLINFRNLMKYKTGTQHLKIKNSHFKKIKDTILFLYNDDYNERKVYDVIKNVVLLNI